MDVRVVRMRVPELRVAVGMGMRLHAVPFRPVRMRGILNDKEAMLAANLNQSIHVRRLARKVHRDHSPCAWCNCSLDLARINVVSIGIDVDENRNRIDLEYG